MGWKLGGLAAVATVAGGSVAARRVVRARADRQGIAAWNRQGAPARNRQATRAQERWHTLTVNRPVDEVAPGGLLPAPLAMLGDTVEVRVSPAPADKGTELAVRVRAGEPSVLGRLTARVRGDDPRWAVRRALRESRSLLETGEVLHPAGPPTTTWTLRSRALQYAIAHGREEGLL